MKKFFGRLKEKWQNWSEGIPRKTKVLLYVLSILLLCFSLYVFKGAPSLSLEHRYRRIECSYMIGPGRILGYEQVSGPLYKNAVLARTEDAVIITTFTPDLYEHEQLLYLPVNGRRILVSAAPQVLSNLGNDFIEETISVFIVDEYPQAVRAELDLVLYWVNAQEEVVRPEFKLTAQREKEGYFRMDIPYESYSEVSPEHFALDLFCSWTRTADQFKIPPKEFSATVRLYDADNNLIAEEQQYIFDENVDKVMK